MLPEHNPPRVNTRYRFMGLHAEGSLGRVWLAHDDVLNRVVALKELKQNFVHHPEARARFLREAQVTSQLEHPYIVPVHELCADDHFYTMTFVRGQTLHEAIADHHANPTTQNPIETRHRLMATLVRVCEAVAYAHSRGVIHRDLKPANIMLGAFGEVFVLDWGLAKIKRQKSESVVLEAVEIPLDPGRESTVAGRVMGTPGYMAPEQAAGRSDQIDERTDVYALGAILYKVLTGVSPHECFEGAKPTEYLRHIVESPIPPARTLIPTVPAALEAIAARALEKDPARRYVGAMELANELRHWIEGLPIQAYREPWGQRVVRMLARHRTLVQAGAFALLAACIVIVGIVWQTLSDVRTMRRVQLARLEDQVNLMHAALGANLGDIRRSTNLICNTARVEAYGKSLTDENLERRALAELNARQLLMSVALSKPNCRRIALVGASDNYKEMIAVERTGAADTIHVVARQDLRSLGESRYFIHIAEVLQSRPGDFYFSHFRKVDSAQEPNDLALLAVERIHSDPDCWLTIQMDYHPFLREFLSDSAGRTIVTLVCDEDRHTLFLHRTGPDAQWLESARDPAFDEFFADPRQDVLAAQNFGSHRDVVYARKLHYDPSRMDRYLGVLMVAAYHGAFADQFRQSYLLLAILVPLLVLALAGASFVLSHLLKARSQA